MYPGNSVDMDICSWTGVCALYTGVPLGSLRWHLANTNQQLVTGFYFGTYFVEASKIILKIRFKN